MNKQKIMVVSALCALMSITAGLSHEFWLFPSSFFPQVGKPVPVSINVGENYEGERWGGGNRRVQRLRLITPKGEQNLTASISQSDSLVEIKPLILKDGGTQMITLETNNSFIELEANKFLEYLKEDGLDNAVAYRREHKETTKKGREQYRRCAKTLLQAGNVFAANVTKSSGMAMEIVPLQNPYSLPKGSLLTCQVLYENRPLKNALVRCWRRVNGKTELEFKRSDAAGNATFDLPKKGNAAYMISAVTMVRLTNNPKADWQSTWGSLTFGMK